MLRKVTILTTVLLVGVLSVLLIAAERPAASSITKLLDEQRQIVKSMKLSDLTNPESEARQMMNRNCQTLIDLGVTDTQKMASFARTNYAKPAPSSELTINPSGISGHVYDLATGLPPFIMPFSGIPIGPAFIWVEREDGSFTTTILTQIDGSYEMYLAPGRYKVWCDGEPPMPMFFTLPNHYLPQYYLNASSYETATFVEILPGEITQNVDFHLSEGGVISGNIFDQVTKEPIPMVFQVYAYNYEADEMHFVMFDFTVLHAGYRVTGLTSGKYIVVVVPFGIGEPALSAEPMMYDWEVYNNEGFFEDASPVNVTIGVETANINFYLTTGGRFAGIVRDNWTGQRLANAEVILFDEEWNQVDTDITNCNGRYRLEAPHLGKYYIYTSGLVDGLYAYWPEYFRNRPDQAHAKAVWMEYVGERVHHPINLNPKEGFSKIDGVVWNDINNDGVQDAGEPGLADVVLHICPMPAGPCSKPKGWAFPFIGNIDGGYDINESGPLDTRTDNFDVDDGCSAVVTDANGNYLFKRIPIGHWQISVDAPGVPTANPNPLLFDVLDIDQTYTFNFGFGTVAPPNPVIPKPDNLPAQLVFIKGSPSDRKQTWHKAVDGILDGKKGTATVRGEDPNPNQPAWAIFAFSDSGTYKFDGISIQTENGEFDFSVNQRFRERMAHGIEILVSGSDTDPASFVSVLDIYKDTGEMELFKLEEFKTAKYVKIIIDEPNFLQGGWRQLVELVLMSGPKPGVQLVAEKTLLTAVPEETGLEQNFPNPFNPSTTIRYRLATDAQVSLRVYDLAGREVANLYEGQMNAGMHEVTWNASQQASGVYFVRMQAGSAISMRRIVLMK